MNFKVIYKGKSHESVVADAMSDIDSEKLQSAFMVVATEKVSGDNPYLAAQLKANQTLVCTKAGAVKVEAESIDEALNDDVTRYTLTFTDPSGKATSIPNALIVKEGTELTELPAAVVNEEEYVFNGWKIGEDPVEFPYTVNADATLVADIEDVIYYNVSFTDPDEHASSLPETIIVKEGTQLEEGDIPNPVPAEGYTFDGWLVGSNPLHYPLSVTHDFTLKASFVSA